MKAMIRICLTNRALVLALFAFAKAVHQATAGGRVPSEKKQPLNALFWSRYDGGKK